jgi:hypothetical protein
MRMEGTLVMKEPRAFASLIYNQSKPVRILLFTGRALQGKLV